MNYFRFGFDIKLANNLQAPGTAAGNSRKKTSPVYINWPFPYLQTVIFPLFNFSPGSVNPKGNS